MSITPYHHVVTQISVHRKEPPSQGSLYNLWSATPSPVGVDYTVGGRFGNATSRLEWPRPQRWRSMQSGWWAPVYGSPIDG